MRVSDDVLFEDETVNNETTVSEAVSLEHIYGYAVWASWAGNSITGSIKLQASVDGDNWLDVASSSQTISSASSYMWNVADAMYKYFRVSVTSGNTNDITVNCKFSAKGV